MISAVVFYMPTPTQLCLHPMSTPTVFESSFVFSREILAYFSINGSSLYFDIRIELPNSSKNKVRI